MLVFLPSIARPVFLLSPLLPLIRVPSQTYVDLPGLEPSYWVCAPRTLGRCILCAPTPFLTCPTPIPVDDGVPHKA
jgi:hypothetical protein